MSVTSLGWRRGPIRNPSVRRQAVGDDARFDRLPFALAVAAVIEQEDRCVEFIREQRDQVGVVGTCSPLPWKYKTTLVGAGCS